ncbi:hypothetical protein CP10881SC42_1017, partial [Chlamydia avium]
MEIREYEKDGKIYKEYIIDGKVYNKENRYKDILHTREFSNMDWHYLGHIPNNLKTD